jgi:hypothetical protein
MVGLGILLWLLPGYWAFGYFCNLLRAVLANHRHPSLPWSDGFLIRRSVSGHRKTGSVAFAIEPAFPCEGGKLEEHAGFDVQNVGVAFGLSFF